ncbi:50S ribosomal protein L22 [Candidatus Woesearchaeota archaeon]|nr:50S ribosomal protein L22 [Candidatus Woesearchaeota archaeon]
MADYHYAYEGPTAHTAKAVLKEAPISPKVAVELSSYLKGKTTAQAKAVLERVVKREQAIPYKRFTDGVGHKRGMAAGRYPGKAAKHFLQLIHVAEANANQAGLASDLKIIHLLAHKASSPFRFGRQRRRQMKQAHVEIVVKEVEGAKRKAVKQQLSKPAKEGSVVDQSAPAKRPPAKKQAAKASEKEEPARPGKKQPPRQEKKKATSKPAEKKGQQPAPKKEAPKKKTSQPQTTQPSPKENAQQ